MFIDLAEGTALPQTFVFVESLVCLGEQMICAHIVAGAKVVDTPRREEIIFPFGHHIQFVEMPVQHPERTLHQARAGFDTHGQKLISTHSHQQGVFSENLSKQNGKMDQCLIAAFVTMRVVDCLESIEIEIEDVSSEVARAYLVENLFEERHETAPVVKARQFVDNRQLTYGALEPVAFHAVEYASPQEVVVEAALDQKILGSQLYRTNTYIFMLSGREYNHGHLWRGFGDGSEGLQAAAVRKIEIEQHSIKVVPRKGLEGLGEGTFVSHGKPTLRIAKHNPFGGCRLQRFVLDEQHFDGRINHRPGGSDDRSVGNGNGRRYRARFVIGDHPRSEEKHELGTLGFRVGAGEQFTENRDVAQYGDLSDRGGFAILH